MDKAPDAYRTISEVGEDLDIAQHVLRFWETRFPQIRPLKRGGGRRYYRPDDVELLKGIRHLLYREGYTIKGVQRILKEQGIRAVQAVGRQGSLVPGLAPAAPEQAEDFVDPPGMGPAMPGPVSPLPAIPRPGIAALPPIPPVEEPGLDLFMAPAPFSHGEAPLSPLPLPPRAMEGQVSFTRGGLSPRPTAAPERMADADAAMTERREPGPLGDPAREALREALAELESARVAIGRVLASRDRPVQG